MMHTVALGETSGAAVSDGFLRAFRTNPELAAFFGTWFTEELNHFLGYHMYLRQMGEPWPAARGLAVAETRGHSRTPTIRWKSRRATCTRSCSASSSIARSRSR